MTRHAARTAAIHGLTFTLGGVIMGFEMLGSRYLFPYFGSGLNTWAALISVVLGSMTAGYALGGTLAGRPGTQVLQAALVAGAAAYMACTPAAASGAMEGIVQTLGDGPWGAMAAAAELAAVPMALLATMSPMAVRMLDEGVASGRTSGLVSASTTAGSIAGVLTTSYALIPHIGSRQTTHLFAAIAAMCAAGLALLKDQQR